MKRLTSPDVRAAYLAASWAQRIGLPPGNPWEPGITRAIVADWQRLGADANAWGFVEAKYTLQLGLTQERPK